MKLGGVQTIDTPSKKRTTTTSAVLIALAGLLASLVLPARPAFADTFVTAWGATGSADSQFQAPVGIATDAASNVYVADRDNHRIQKFNSVGTFVTKWGTLGSSVGKFNSPSGVATDGAGNVYVADRTNNRIQKFSPAGAFMQVFTSGALLFPMGVAVDGAGNVYVANESNHNIVKFGPTGTLLTSWGSFGSLDGQFRFPVGIAVKGAGDVFVADRGNHRIQRFTQAGVFVTAWGTEGSGDGEFDNPTDVALGPLGQVYVTDRGNNRVQEFTSTGGFLATWGGPGDTNGSFDSPDGVATDAAGNVYVADTGNNRIQKFSDATKVVTISPTGGGISTTPTYVWNAVAGSTDYQLWVNAPGGATVINSMHTAAAAGCAAGAGTCQVTPATVLAAGTHTWWVRARNGTFFGPWSVARTFTVATAVPAQVVTVSPTGGGISTTPTYVWNALTTASDYQLWVNAPGGATVINSMHTKAAAGCAAGTGTCQVTPATTLASGTHTWWVRARNGVGFGPWSVARTFTVGAVPDQVTTVSPSGNTTNRLPTYVWNAVSGATDYQLWVNAPGGVTVINNTYTAAVAACAGGTGTCRVTPATALGTGTHTWWVRARNGGALGPWSVARTFTEL